MDWAMLKSTSTSMKIVDLALQTSWKDIPKTSKWISPSLFSHPWQAKGKARAPHVVTLLPSELLDGRCRGLLDRLAGRVQLSHQHQGSAEQLG